MAELFRPSTSAGFRFRGHQLFVWAGEAILGIVLWKRVEIPKRRTLERNGGGLLNPSASVGFRRLQRASVDIRGLCGRKMEAGKWLGARWRNGRNGRNYGRMGEL